MRDKTPANNALVPLTPADHPLEKPEQETVSFLTDTATPQTVIPIFYLHPDPHPFCTKPGCLCLKNNEQLELLLRAIISRDLRLKRVVNGTIE